MFSSFRVNVKQPLLSDMVAIFCVVQTQVRHNHLLHRVFRVRHLQLRQDDVTDGVGFQAFDREQIEGGSVLVGVEREVKLRTNSLVEMKLNSWEDCDQNMETYSVICDLVEHDKHSNLVIENESPELVDGVVEWHRRDEMSERVRKTLVVENHTKTWR